MCVSEGGGGRFAKNYRELFLTNGMHINVLWLVTDQRRRKRILLALAYGDPCRMVCDVKSLKCTAWYTYMYSDGVQLHDVYMYFRYSDGVQLHDVSIL